MKITYKSILIALLTLVLIGTVFYHYQEGWSYLDSFYFTVITMSTIGYGDFSPKTDFGKLFTVGYVFVGLGLFATFLDLSKTRRLEKVEKRRSDKK